MNTRNASMNLRRSGVWSLYAFQSVCTAAVLLGGGGVDFEDELDFGPIGVDVVKRRSVGTLSRFGNSVNKKIRDQPSNSSRSMRNFGFVSHLSLVKNRTRISWLSGRGIHRLRELPYNIEEGLGEFLPPQALKTVALDYQQGLLDRLNEAVRGGCCSSRCKCMG
jgi:hypothetical protein